MDEQQFQQAALQAKAKAIKHKQPETIDQALKSKTGAENLSRPSNGTCDCGATLPPIKVGSKWYVPQFCQECMNKHCVTKYQPASLMPGQTARQRRKVYVEQMHRCLGYAIPPLFAKARLRDLNPQFCEALLKFNPLTGIVLYGPVGRGKSYAMSALIRYLVLQEKRCSTILYEMLCLEIRATYKSNARAELDVIGPLINCEVLFIEDIGSTTSIGKSETDFSNRTFYTLLETRLRACRPTLITTNKTPDNLAASFDSRIASRLKMFPWLGAGGMDRRENK